MTAAQPGLVTEVGIVLGTIAYMSPEQAEGAALDHRTNIFSLGITLYEMVTGRRPFSGDSRIALLSSIMKDAPPEVTEVRGELPRQLGRILKHALEKDPEQRFQSVLDLHNELEQLRTELATAELLASAAASRPMTVESRSRIGLKSVLAGAAIIIALSLVFDVGGLRTRMTGDSQPIAPVIAQPSGCLLERLPAGCSRRQSCRRRCPDRAGQWLRRPDARCRCRYEPRRSGRSRPPS
ncbi:MAG: protein kinase [Acidobacteria bacterium]|nr:protein kinase [Acidobacteriota bacterium]